MRALFILLNARKSWIASLLQMIEWPLIFLIATWIPIKRRFCRQLYLHFGLGISTYLLAGISKASFDLSVSNPNHYGGTEVYLRSF